MRNSVAVAVAVMLALVGGAALYAASRPADVQVLTPAQAPSSRPAVDVAAPGTSVQSDDRGVRVRAPFVDIEVPKRPATDR